MRQLIDNPKSAYIARCHRTLKEWGAPLEGWIISSTYDRLEEKAELFTCELCGCKQVRIVHVMQHDNYFERVSVGCICAGVMEGNILAAKERDRLMKNRAKRRMNFPKRKWQETPYGVFLLMYKGKLIHIARSRTNPKQFWVSYDSKHTETYKGKPITNFLSAAYAAFDLVDPVEVIWNA